LLVKEPPNGFQRPDEVEIAGQFLQVVFLVAVGGPMINTLGGFLHSFFALLIGHLFCSP
jgi:hypothetical protein